MIWKSIKEYFLMDNTTKNFPGLGNSLNYQEPVGIYISFCMMSF